LLLVGSASRFGDNQKKEVITKHMKPKIEAKIILLLRDQDVNLLLKAMQQFKPENKDDANGRRYLLEVLEYLAVPE
jgi:hypothetical protein